MGGCYDSLSELLTTADAAATPSLLCAARGPLREGAEPGQDVHGPGSLLRLRGRMGQERSNAAGRGHAVVSSPTERDEKGSADCGEGGRFWDRT